MSGRDRNLAEMWARHSAEWRDGAQVCSQWREAANLDPALLESHTSKGWWKTVAELGITLLITREYEHLAMAASAPEGRPRLSFFPVPHPSGLAVDRVRKRVYLASTRNPNQLFTLKPAGAALARTDLKAAAPKGNPLTPVATASYPGSLYLHDLAVIGSSLYGNAVGHNAIVRLGAEGAFERVWWPKCIERAGDPVFTRNHIQLNSIAAGPSLRESYFSASSDVVGRLRPGHLNYPVDGHGVIFSGRTREPVCTGLTRPHSARLRGREVWVANSGYGELGFVRGGRLEVVTHLPGWTRGLCIVKDVAFVATSRVIPRYARYAPGLHAAASRCAVHAVSCASGEVLGSLEWPNGNQVFAIDWLDVHDSTGFVFEARSRRQTRETAFFYTYLTERD
jgi:uncharacterized protein (TIGR03032 family)